jgi:hypothetical protein
MEYYYYTISHQIILLHTLFYHIRMTLYSPVVETLVKENKMPDAL